METFGASAPLKELQKKFGFTPENVVAAAKQQIARSEVNDARRDRFGSCRVRAEGGGEELPDRGASRGPRRRHPQHGSGRLFRLRRSRRRSRCARSGPSAASSSAAAALARRWPRTGFLAFAPGLCHDTYSAHQGVEHDDMNVLVLGGRVVGIELARELIRAFLNARFTGEARHLRRLAKMTALENPLRALQVFGQSVWLDYIRRSLITSGELRRLIDEDGLRGVTSNPAIFEKAVAGSSDYREIARGAGRAGAGCRRRFTSGSRSAIFRTPPMRCAPCTRRPRQRDGYVSLEVSPLARVRHGRHARRSPAIVAGGRARQSDDQSPGDAAGHSRDPAADRRGHQRQRDAALCAGRVRAGGGSVHRGAGEACRPRRRPAASGQRRQLLHQPDRYRHRCARRGAAAGGDGCEREQACCAA